MTKKIYILCLILLTGLLCLLGWPDAEIDTAKKSDQIVLGGQIDVAGTPLAGAQLTLWISPSEPGHVFDDGYYLEAISRADGSFEFRDSTSNAKRSKSCKKTKRIKSKKLQKACRKKKSKSTALNYALRISANFLPSHLMFVNSNGTAFPLDRFVRLELPKLSKNKKLRTNQLSQLVQISTKPICGESDSLCGSCENVQCDEKGSCQCCNDSYCQELGDSIPSDFRAKELMCRASSKVESPLSTADISGGCGQSPQIIEDSSPVAVVSAATQAGGPAGCAIQLYSDPSFCPPCVLLDTWLTQQGLNLGCLRISKSTTGSPVGSIPHMIIPGQPGITGFKPTEILAALNKSKCLPCKCACALDKKPYCFSKKQTTPKHTLWPCDGNCAKRSCTPPKKKKPPAPKPGTRCKKIVQKPSSGKKINSVRCVESKASGQECKQHVDCIHLLKYCEKGTCIQATKQTKFKFQKFLACADLGLKLGDACPTPTPTPTTSGQPTPKPTLTINPTPRPTLTINPTPKPTLTIDPTPKPTLTIDPTPKPTITIDPTPKPTPTTNPSPKPSPKPTLDKECSNIVCTGDKCTLSQYYRCVEAKIKPVAETAANLYCNRPDIATGFLCGPSFTTTSTSTSTSTSSSVSSTSSSSSSTSSSSSSSTTTTLPGIIDTGVLLPLPKGCGSSPDPLGVPPLDIFDPTTAPPPAAPPATCPSTNPGCGGWLTESQYQTHFTSLKSRYYPRIVKGRKRSSSAQAEYAATFYPYSLFDGWIGWQSFHGASDSEYNQIRNYWQNRGYVMIYHQSFYSDGAQLHQGTLVKCSLSF